jgi:hypothetical protein
MGPYTFLACALDELGEENWLSFISTRRSTIYHHPLWHRTIERTYGIKPLYVVMTDVTGVIKAAVPGAVVRTMTGAKRFVSFPFSDVCGPVADGPHEFGLIAGTLASVNDLPEKTWSQSELRTENAPALEKYSEYKGYCGHILKLGRPIDDVFDSFHKDCVQRRIRKAFRAGLEVYEGSTISDMKDFYGLHLITRKKIGAPVQPFSFFRNLWELLSTEGHISLLIVKKRKTPVSGVVMLKYRKRAIYKFGASDENFLNLGGNQLALWTAIKKASVDGFLEFDFGRSFSGNRGLNDFKARWGADEVRLSYLYSPEKNIGLKDEGGTCGRIASAVFRKLPPLSNRLIGRLFYKYLA